MKLSSLSRAELSFRLRSGGLRLRTGPFVFSIHSKLDRVSAGLAKIYSDFSVVTPETFADFHITLRHARGLRRFVRPQSVFELDGKMPFLPLAGNQAFALLEWGMNWCIYSHAHSFLIIHGAVLERHGQALIMPAPSGSGKSTLCAALMNRGWRLLSDELVLIDPDDGKIYPLGRPVSLKNRSIDVLRIFSPDAFISEPIHDTAKGSVAHMKPSTESVVRSHEAVLPRWVIFPCYIEASGTSIRPIIKPELFMRLVDNAFNYSVLRENGFSSVAGVVDRVSGFDATYSDLSDIILKIDRLVEGASVGS